MTQTLITSVVFPPTGKNTVYRLPSILVLTDQTILLFCEERLEGPDDLGPIRIVMRRSVDGGRTWEPLQLLASGGQSKVGNMCPIFDGVSQTVYLIYCVDLTHAYVVKSTDAGETFSLAREITGTFSEFDFPWQFFAAGPSHGVTAPDGRLVAPVFLCDSPRETATATYLTERPTRRPTGSFRQGIIFSDDAGDSWHAGGLVPSDTLIEGSLYVGADGSYHLNMRDEAGGGWRQGSSSGDRGRTWTPPYRLSVPDPTCQGSVTTSPDARVILASNLDSTGRRNNLVVRASYDDGHTWPTRLSIHEGPSGYSDLTVGPSRTVWLAFENGATEFWERISVASFGYDLVVRGLK